MPKNLGLTQLPLRTMYFSQEEMSRMEPAEVIERAQYLMQRCYDFTAAIRLLDHLVNRQPSPYEFLSVANELTGICFMRLRRDQEDIELARICFDDAEINARDDARRASILRNRGELESLAGDTNHALSLFNRAMAMRPQAEYPVEYATTLGYRGQALVKAGHLHAGLMDLQAADVILHEEDDRKAELYILLHRIAALSKQHDYPTKWSCLQRAWQLARDHGARAHRLRVLELAIGGWRLDAWVSRRRHRKQTR